MTEVVQDAQLLAAQGRYTASPAGANWPAMAGTACVFTGDASAPVPFIEQQLQASAGPIIAATDYVCAVPESVRAFLPADRSYLTLGTDGFGRSDTRAALWGYFGGDAASICGRRWGS